MQVRSLDYAGLPRLAGAARLSFMADNPTAPERSGPSVRRVPEGDNRERLVCPDCGFIHYDNPKVVVGAVATWEDRILLCLRAINPRRGFWTLPAGYLELNETVIDGARREAWEEARAEIEIDGLLGLYNVPRISQVQIFFRARLVSPDVSAGPESEEVGLFTWDEIPWDDLAFPSVRWALDHFRELGGTGEIFARFNPPGETGDLRR
jgi:ADP-ribose pyrophosphatase YjhB (NUDIX family)